MALKKTFSLPDGSSAEYIRISELKSNKLQITVVVDLYKSKADRDAGKDPSERSFKMKKMFPNPPTTYTFDASSYTANWYDEAYDFLKTLPDFSGAEDA